MRRTASVLLVAAAAALGACGDNDDGSATEPAGQQTATEAGKEKVPLEGSVAEGAGKQTEIAPGTRGACIREWAPQFPEGPAREAVLEQCRQLPR